MEFFSRSSILFLIFYVLLVFSNNLVNADKKASASGAASTSAESKLQQISELAAKSRGNIITLDDATFNYYAMSKPRPYSLIVFMTAAHPKFKCSICKTIDSELALVASTYNSQKKDETNPVFFVRLDYEAAQKTFQSYGVNSVPVVFHISPLLSAEKSASKENFNILTRDKFQIPTTPDAESISSFLRDRTGISVEIKRSMIGSYIMLMILFGLMTLMVRPVINSLPWILSVVRQRGWWVLISSGIYTCAISGLIFDIIRSPQMYYANPQTGQIMFFYPQSGNQFVVEGFVIGFLNLACALAAMLVLIAPQIKDESYRTLAMIGGIVVFILCFRMIRSLYIMKNQWYGQKF